MAYKDFDGLQLDINDTSTANHFSADGTSNITLPDSSYIRDASFERDGADLILDGPNGTATIENYFSQAESPTLSAEDGSVLTPNMVNSFVQSPSIYASNMSMNDESPIGSIQEISGDATVTRTDGTIEPLTLGSPIYQGDIVETAADGAVNISFADESSFAISEDARLAIDEFVYDPVTEEGSQDFSVLKGIFVFTSGLVGRDDPDDVNIDTPSGSIGIRGTIIAGDVDNGEITVVEGAIVVRDFSGNEMTLASQFETAKFMPADEGGGIQNLGQLNAQGMGTKFSGISKVAPTLFSSVNDVAAEGAANGNAEAIPEGEAQDLPAEEAGVNEEAEADANGAADQDGDSEVDGTVDEGAEGEGENAEQPTGEEGEGELGARPNGGELNPTNEPNNTNNTANANGTNTAAMEMGNVSNDGTGGNTGDGDITSPQQPSNNDTQNQNSTDTGSTTEPPPPPPPILDLGDPARPPIVFSDFITDQGLSPSTAPDAFFAAGDGQNWAYNFDKEFGDGGSSGIIGYQLSAATILELDTKLGFGQWSFSNANGRLQTSTPLALSGDDNITLEVRAISTEGASDWLTHNLELKNDTGLSLSTLTTASVVTGVYSETTIALAGEVIGGGGTVTNVDIFLGSLADDLNLQTINSYINLGEGDNTITVYGSSTGNTIVGSDGAGDIDIIELKNGANDVYAMDGDDTIILNLDYISSESEFAGKTIDGGWSDLTAISELQLLGLDINGNRPGGNGWGDTLEFQDASSNVGIDFSLIAEGTFTGIERIAITGGGSTNIINLSYNDIVSITDDANTLIFTGDTNDILTFNFSGQTRTTFMDDQLITDQGTANQQFDIYQYEGDRGTVTILIQQDGIGNDNITVTGI